MPLIRPVVRAPFGRRRRGAARWRLSAAPVRAGAAGVRGAGRGHRGRRGLRAGAAPRWRCRAAGRIRGAVRPHVPLRRYRPEGRGILANPPQAGSAEARRRLAALRKDAATLAGIDFFPGRARQQLEEALVEAELALNARFSPAEPRASAQVITPRRRQDYQRRLWATRQRPWVDRLCSAWLILRFIDPKARFVWLKSPADLPRNAVGFDFEGAEFAHAGSRVTFQVLAASFGLEADEATILAGARAAAGSDDELLDAAFPVIDHLHAGFRCAQTPPSSRAASAPSPPRARRRPASSPSAARNLRT